jgi:hypothetical protein
VHAVFVPDSSEGMTSGAHPSVAGGEARYRFGKERKRPWAASAVGLEVVPVALSLFPYFLFFFSVCFCFENCLKLVKLLI